MHVKPVPKYGLMPESDPHATCGQEPDRMPLCVRVRRLSSLSAMGFSQRPSRLAEFKAGDSLDGMAKVPLCQRFTTLSAADECDRTLAPPATICTCGGAET